MTNLEIAKRCAEILDNKKGIDVTVVKIDELSSIADYLVLATGTSSTHVKSLADEVEFQMKESGIMPGHIEGHRSNSWILIDYKDVIVHVFSSEARNFYNLDKLFEKGEIIEVS